MTFWDWFPVGFAGMFIVAFGGWIVWQALDLPTTWRGP